MGMWSLRRHFRLFALLGVVVIVGGVVASFAPPAARAADTGWTIVNGEITFEDGKCTGAMPGQLLRNGKIGLESFTAAAR